jgi:hypothetical protein
MTSPSRVGTMFQEVSNRPSQSEKLQSLRHCRTPWCRNEMHCTGVLGQAGCYIGLLGSRGPLAIAVSNQIPTSEWGPPRPAPV